MQMYEDKKKGTSRNSCGYCRRRGHNRLQCPEVAKDWAWWKDFTVPPFSASTWKNRNYPKYWGDWYRDCKETYEAQQAKAAESKNGKKTKRSLPNCGFCGGAGHNRRNCTEMRDFIKKCHKANENWRRVAYKHLVVDNGICVGACIQVRKRDGWSGDYTEHIGIITSVNFDKLNVMAAHDGTYAGHNNPYECVLNIRALVDGEEVSIATLTDKSYHRTFHDGIKTKINHKIIRMTYEGWSPDFFMDRLLSPSEHPLSEEWVSDYKEAFDYLTKKRKKSQLDNDHVTCLINKWSKKV